jgi:hypothetical protein
MLWESSMSNELRNEAIGVRRRACSALSLAASSLAVSSLAVSSLAGCLQPEQEDAGSAGVTPFVPPAAAPPASMPTPMAMPVVTGGEARPPVSAPLDMPVPAEQTPEAEPPLSAAEQAAVAGFDGLVRATDWKAPVAPAIT